MEDRMRGTGMSEKKALFIAAAGGFVTQFELNNVSLLQQMGYEVHSAANFKEPVYCVRELELKEKGIILHQVDIAKSPFMWKKNLQALKQICNIIKEQEITLIHCHTPVGGLLGRLAGILCRSEHLKVIYTAHGFHFYKGAPWINWLLYYSVERLLAHYTDTLVTINEEDYAKAQGFKLRRNGKIYKIPGEGLNMEAFKPITDRQKAKLRKKLGMEEDVFFILSVGELCGNKNHKAIIRLIPEMRKRLPGKKLLYGICGDGYFHEELQKLINEMDLQRYVKLYGYQEKVTEFLACADCLLFPSIREGLGMAALEALAMGIPVIASDNRGTREYMEDSRNGLVCSVKKPEEFIDAVEKICRMEPEQLSAMVIEGRKTAQKFESGNTRVIMSDVYLTVDAEKIPEQRVEIRYIDHKNGRTVSAHAIGRNATGQTIKY